MVTDAPGEMAMTETACAPIFLIGTGRSGTNLLRMMLNAHPRIYIMHEGGFYFWHRWLPANCTAGQWCARYFHCDPFFPWYRVNPAEIRQALGWRINQRPAKDAYCELMRRLADRHQRERVGSQSPLNTLALRQLFRDFPEARVIHVVRDPRTAMASFARRPSSSSSLLLNCDYLRRNLRAVQPFVGRIHEVRVEDLLSTPRTALEEVLRFVGEPWNDQLLEYAAHTPLDLPPFPWFRGQSRRQEQPASDWRHDLSPAWIRIIERRFRPMMRKHGYAPAGPEFQASLRAVGRAIVDDLPELVQSLRRVADLLRGLRQPVPIDGEEFLRRSLQLNPQAWKYYPTFSLPQAPAPDWIQPVGV
jgi:hypothetical protein